MMLLANEVANKLRVTPKTIREWAREGILPFMRVGRKYLFDPCDVEKVVKSRAKFEPSSLKIERKLKSLRGSRSNRKREDLWL